MVVEGIVEGADGPVGLVELEADMAEVCGWLIPTRNGLNSHDGANFDLVLRDLRSGVAVAEVVVEVERVDPTDRIDDREGEELNPLEVIVENLDSGSS
jgi:hypothetical protein